MEQLDSFILDLALILVASAVVTIIFRKIKQPVVLGYILAGFLISPNFEWLPTVISSESIKVWADIGIVFLMFGIGLEFNLHKVAEVGMGAIITALVVIGGMITVGYSIGLTMGWDTMDCVFIGCMISMSSTMIVIKAYDELGLKRRRFATLVVGVLVIEDMAGIFMMIILKTISVSKNFSGTELFRELGLLMLILIGVLIAGIYIIPTLVKRVEPLLTDELLLILSLGLCLLMVVVSVGIGFSEALGAFLAGSILAGTLHAERIEHLVQPIKDLFGAVFFVSVGMMIVPHMLVQYWLQIIILSVVVAIGQPIFAGIGCLISGQELKTAVRAGCSMCQVGEFSFILATLGTSLGVTSDFLYPIIVCVSVITAFTTPVLIGSGEKVYFGINKILPAKLKEKIKHYTSRNSGVSFIDKDWKDYLVKKVIKLLIGTAGLFSIYLVVVGIIEPELMALFGEEELICDFLLELVAIVMMSPFIYIMCKSRNRTFMKLWYKSDFNKLPLAATQLITLFVATVFVTLILRRYLFFAPLIVDGIISVLIIFAIMSLSFFGGKFSKIQTRFFVNFNERIIERDKLERKTKANKMWVDEKMTLMEYQIVDNTGREHIKDMISNKAYGCMIISIFHQTGEIINLPKAGAELHNGDILTVIGSEEGIDSYSKALVKSKNITESKNGTRTLKEYLYFQMFDDDIKPENQLMCCALKPLERNDFMCSKQVKDSRFIAKYDGYMIAIERQGMQILSPERSEILQEGDIIWCLGTQEMVGKLQEDNVLML